jgi:hypothetical protein
LEAIGQAIAAHLVLGDALVAGDVGVVDIAAGAVGVEAGVQAGGEEAGFQRGTTEQGELGEGDAFQSEDFLGVNGLVEGGEIDFEVIEELDVFEVDDGETGGGETVFAGILGRTGFAFGAARAGGMSGVGAIGLELFLGDGFLGTWHGDSDLSFSMGMGGVWS